MLLEKARIKAEQDALQAIEDAKQHFVNMVVSMQRRFRLGRYYKIHVKGKRMSDIENSHSSARHRKVYKNKKKIIKLKKSLLLKCVYMKYCDRTIS